MNKTTVKFLPIIVMIFLSGPILGLVNAEEMILDSNYIKAIEYGSQGKFENAEREFKMVKGRQYKMSVHISLNIIKDVAGKKIAEDTAMHLFAGSSYLEKKDVKKALAEFNEAIASNPDYLESYRKRSMAYAVDGKFNKAISEMTNVIKKDPANAYFYYTRGTIHFENEYRGIAIDTYGKAIDDYSKAIKIAPDNASFYEQRAIAYFADGKYRKAENDFNKALAIEPDNPDFYRERGDNYISLEQYSKANDDYNTAIKIDPTNASAYISRGVVNYKIVLNYDAAIEDFNAAVKLKPDNVIAYQCLADAYCRKHDYNKAWETVNKIIELKGKVNPAFIAKLKKESGRE